MGEKRGIPPLRLKRSHSARPRQSPTSNAYTHLPPAHDTRSSLVPPSVTGTTLKQYKTGMGELEMVAEKHATDTTSSETNYFTR